MSLSLPIQVDQDKDYRSKLEEIFTEYSNYLTLYKASVKEMYEYHHRTFSNTQWAHLEQDINNTSNQILNSIDLYYLGKQCQAQSIIQSLLQNIIEIDETSNTPYFITELDRSYATRLVAPFPFLHHSAFEANVMQQKKYEIMNTAELSFFRARTESVTDAHEMLHIPLDERDKVSTQRFSVPGIPCLYLGTSTYDVWHEMGKPPSADFYVSSVKLNDAGKKLKILNLFTSISFIQGLTTPYISEEYTDDTFTLLSCALKIWPLVCATSFRVKSSKRSFHSEYIISHLIMLSLSELKIDGIAYSSKQFPNSAEVLILPQMINIAIPIFESNTKYGSICNGFRFSDPVNFAEFLTIEPFNSSPHCYYRKITALDDNTNSSEFDSVRSIPINQAVMPYDNLSFCRFDNYLSCLLHK